MTQSTATIQWKGHTRVGRLSTQGPRCSESLTLRDAQMSITSKLGEFTFSPQTVERIERTGLIPWFSTGIQIHHRVSSYPRRIGFWPRGISTRVVLCELQQRGYRVASPT